MEFPFKIYSQRFVTGPNQTFYAIVSFGSSTYAIAKFSLTKLTPTSPYTLKYEILHE